MNVITKNNISVAVINDKKFMINNIGDALDIMASARYYDSCIGLVIDKECINEDFFDLKTGFAGEMLQKFINYKMKIAIAGDLSEYTGKAIKDFIYECNSGNDIFFKENIEKAADAILERR